MRYYFLNKEAQNMNPLKKYIWLVDTVMRAGNKGLTLKQISRAYEFADEISEGNQYSNRSLHRHRNEVKDIFGIEIECYSDGAEYRYRIADDKNNSYFRQWLIDSISVNRVLEESKELAPYIAIESPQTSCLPEILQAMKDLRMLSFDYKPYWAEKETHYFNFQPHALKMFEHRWYMIGKYGHEHPFRIFALDRINQMEVQEEPYQRDPNFSLEKMFEGNFGIILGEGEPETIWLKVDAYQANYLRSVPLHQSQIEITRKKGYTLFALKVRITYDLLQRILSLGSKAEVVKPESLRQMVKDEVLKMAESYQEEEEE